MNREELFAQVKAGYAKIASDKSQQQTILSTTEETPEAYFERLLNKTLKEIEQGKFDNFTSGEEVIKAVADRDL